MGKGGGSFSESHSLDIGGKKIIELYTLNRWIVWYMDYISRKLFKYEKLG